MKKFFNDLRASILRKIAPQMCIDKYILKTNPYASFYTLSYRKEVKLLRKMQKKGKLTAEFINEREWSPEVVTQMIRDGVKGIKITRGCQLLAVIETGDEEEIMRAFKHFTPSTGTMYEALQKMPKELVMKLAKTYPHHFDGLCRRFDDWAAGAAFERALDFEIVEYLYQKGIWDVYCYLRKLSAYKQTSRYKEIMLELINSCDVASDKKLMYQAETAMTFAPDVFEVYEQKFLASSYKEVDLVDWYVDIVRYADRNQTIFRLCKKWTGIILKKLESKEISYTERLEDWLFTAMEFFLAKGENKLAEKIANAFKPEGNKKFYQSGDKKVFIVWS